MPHALAERRGRALGLALGSRFFIMGFWEQIPRLSPYFISRSLFLFPHGFFFFGLTLL